MNIGFFRDVFSGRLAVIYPDRRLAAVPETGLVIPTFNRPDYLRTSLESLRNSRLEGVLVVIVDDASSEPETLETVKSLTLPHVPVIKIFKRRRKGFAAHESVRMGWDLLSGRYGCRFLCCLDADTLVKPDWLIRMRSLFDRERPRRGPLIVTGFNAQPHPVLSEGVDFYLKKVVGGISMFFDREMYRDVVRPNLKLEPATGVGWDWHVIYEMERRGYPFLCTKPSVVQHIGCRGVYSTAAGGYDVALDY
jgi:glycosyltransferase involved in cell wall biosynthesis